MHHGQICEEGESLGETGRGPQEENKNLFFLTSLGNGGTHEKAA